MLVRSLSLGLIAVLVLSSCSSQPGREQAETSTDIQELDYVSENGASYRIRYRWDNLMAAYGLDIARTSGAPLSTDLSDDIEVQNTLRDAFRANVCKEGLHPGLLKLHYGPWKDNLWTANVKCTTKFQPNA